MDSEQIDGLARQFSLASMLAAYPDHEVEATCQLLGPALREHAGPRALLEWLDAAGGSFDELRARYLELFDTGKGRVSLYETEYGRMRAAAKGHDLADISGFYRAFGLAIDEGEGGEMLDHLAVELEFHALMLAKYAHLLRSADLEGAGIVLDATKKFLAQHLGSFAPAAAARVQAAQGDAGYGGLLGWVADLVAAECERVGVTPRPLDYFADAELEAEPKCATNAASLPVIQ